MAKWDQGIAFLSISHSFVSPLQSPRGAWASLAVRDITFYRGLPDVVNMSKRVCGFMRLQIHASLSASLLQSALDLYLTCSAYGWSIWARKKKKEEKKEKKGRITTSNLLAKPRIRSGNRNHLCTQKWGFNAMRIHIHPFLLKLISAGTYL